MVNRFVQLPCGCRITEMTVLGLCMQHALELQDKERQYDKQAAELWAKIEGEPKALGSKTQRM